MFMKLVFRNVRDMANVKMELRAAMKRKTLTLNPYVAVSRDQGADHTDAFTTVASHVAEPAFVLYGDGEDSVRYGGNELKAMTTIAKSFGKSIQKHH